MAAEAKTTWRFIDSGFQSGASNMAADVAITSCVAQNKSMPTVRIYRWQPACISLGYHQKSSDILLDRCKNDQIDVVLRPTGGRAILHADELTYAVMIPPNSEFYYPDIPRMYELISRCLIRALKNLKIPVEFERAENTPSGFNRGELSSLCYASSVMYEIGVGKRKMIGSAQRRMQNAVLQHGSILLGPEHLNITRYLSTGDDEWQERVRNYMQRHTAYLNEFADMQIDYATLGQEIKNGFSQELGVAFVNETPNTAEKELTRELLSKYSILSNT